MLQLLVNVLFCLRDLVPSLMVAPTLEHADDTHHGEGGKGEGGEDGEAGFGLFLTLQSWTVVLYFARMVCQLLIG